MSVAQDQGASGAGATPFSKAFSSSTPVGALILVITDVTVANTFDATTPIADDIGNSYTQIGSELVGSFFRSRAYYAINSTAGTRTITVKTSGGTVEIFLDQFSSHDGIDSNSAGFVHNGVTANFTDSITLQDADAMLIAWMNNNLGNGSITTSGFTNDNPNFPGDGVPMAHKTINAIGSSSVTFSIDNFPTADNAISWLVGIRTVKQRLATMGVGQ